MENKPTPVVALGGNALLKRGEPLEADIQRKNIELAARTLAQLTQQWRVILVHGMARRLDFWRYKTVLMPTSPLSARYSRRRKSGNDWLYAATGPENQLPQREISVLLTQVEVDAHDPAFSNPTKYIGPIYDEPRAHALQAEKAGFSKPMVKRSAVLCPLHNPNESWKVTPFAH